MKSAPHLMQTIGVLTQHSSARIDQTFRSARAAGLIPTSRASRAPEPLLPRHVAAVLVALSIDAVPQQAARLAHRWLRMPERLRDGSHGPLFGDVLTAYLSNDHPVGRPPEVRICREWPMAFSIGHGNLTRVFGWADADEVRAAGFRSTPTRSEACISAGTLHQIAMDLAAVPMGFEREYEAKIVA